MKPFILILTFVGIIFAAQWQRFVNWNEGKTLIAENDSIIWMGTSVGLVKWDVKNNLYQTFDYDQNLYSLDINDLAFDKEKTYG